VFILTLICDRVYSLSSVRNVVESIVAVLSCK